MTKYDRRYIDPEAYGELEALVDEGAEWRGDAPRNAIAEALRSSEVGTARLLTAANNQNLLQEPVQVPLARLTVPKEASRDWCVTWSYQLGFQLPDFGGFRIPLFRVPLAARSYVALTWGAGGAQHRALLDWGRGGSVTLHGTYVSVGVIPILLRDTPPAGFTGQVQNEFSASIAPGRARFENALYYTQYYEDLGDDEIQTLPVPFRATDAMFLFTRSTGEPNVGNGWSLTFLDQSGTNCSQHGIPTNTGARNCWDRGLWCPVPGDAAFCNVQNFGGFANYNQPRVVYRIAI